MDFGLTRSKFRQDAAQTQRILTESRTHPIFSSRGGVAFVEDEVNDFQHRRQARGEIGPARDLEGDICFSQGTLGSHDALGNGRFRDQERPRDLAGRETTEQAQGERNARLGGENRMAGGKDKPQ